MHYEIYLNNARLATGVSDDQSFNVPAYETEYFASVRSNLWRHLVIKAVETPETVIGLRSPNRPRRPSRCAKGHTSPADLSF
jgi:hypothetical protein